MSDLGIVVSMQTIIPASWAQDVNNWTYRCSSIAQLRQQTKSIGARMFVSGYYASGDGGGGIYYYDSTDIASADNGGTIIVAGDGGRWKLANTEPVTVKQFGAKGDGITDDTAAFNLATQAAAAWSSSLQYDIVIPARNGESYKINGTVYIRKGQTLRGSGRPFIDCSGNTTSSSFVLGAGIGGNDPGGSPVKVTDMWTSGGAASHGVFFTSAAGFEIQSIFLTSSGIGLELTNCTDGLISDIEFDQSLSAIVITGGQNLLFSNCNLFVPAFGISFNSNCRDILFTGGIIEYATSTAVLFGDSATSIKGINFSGVNFTMNAQNSGTFQGYIQSRASSVEAQFSGCSFRNMYKWAINHQTGGPVTFTLNDCIFDGTPTTSNYASSSTAMALNTGLNGSYTFLGCEFRNLFGEIATINTGLTKLSLIGGEVVNCDINAASQLRFNIVTVAAARPKITVKGVSGFPYKTNDATHQFVVLPYWGFDTVWKVAIKGNPLATGDTSYARQEEGVYTVSYAFNGTDKRMYADKVLLWKTPTRTLPNDLGAVVCFGSVPGGAVTGAANTPVYSGSICVSVAVAVADAQNFDFYGETGT